MGPDLRPRLPSRPGCNGEGSLECPAHDLNRPPPPADQIRKAVSKRYGGQNCPAPALLVARSLLPWDCPGHRLQHCPVRLPPGSTDTAAGHPGAPLRVRRRGVTSASAEPGSRHSDGHRVLGNSLSNLRKQGPTAGVPHRWATAPPSRRSSPRSRDFRSAAWQNQAEKTSSGASGMPRAMDPQEPPRCFRLPQALLACVFLKALPTGNCRHSPLFRF
ncbi:uncharacterized protein LOC108590430 isoform X2 [Callithrix jacchus]